MRDAHTILDNLRNLLRTKDTAKDALWFIDYLLNNVTTTKPGVPVYNMADAQRFVSVMKRSLIQARYICCIPLPARNFKKNYDLAEFQRSLLNRLTIHAGAYFHNSVLKTKSPDQLGKLQVCLILQSQNQMGQKGRLKAAHSLTFACHVAGIGLGLGGQAF